MGATTVENMRTRAVSLGLVADPVGALGPAGEEDDVPGVEPLGALGIAQGRRPLQDQQPLLLPDLVVVGADRLAGRDLVDADPRLLGPEQLARRAIPARNPSGSSSSYSNWGPAMLSRRIARSYQRKRLGWCA